MKLCFFILILGLIPGPLPRFHTASDEKLGRVWERGWGSLIPRPLPACHPCSQAFPDHCQHASLFSDLHSLIPRPLPACQPCSQASPASFPDHCQHASLVLMPPQPHSQTTASIPTLFSGLPSLIPRPLPACQPCSQASLASFPDHCQHTSLVLRPPQPHSQTTNLIT